MTNEIHIDGVPIFPLNTVLFPHMPLALYIFEHRYKQMIADIRRKDNRFCVALIQEGSEVGGSAEPFEVACLAVIADIRDLPDNEFQLIAVGTERVRILSVDQESKPYLSGSLEVWPDEAEVVDKSLMRRAADMFNQYIDCLIGLSGEVRPKLTLPSEPDNLSFVLATTLQISPLSRQKLLEAAGPGERLRAELDILNTEVPLLRALLNSPRPPEVGGGKFSAN